MQERIAPSQPSAGAFHTGLLTRGQAVLVLSSAAIMLSIAMGLRQSLGLFQTPVVQDLGLQAADFAMAIAVQNIIWGFTQPFAGALVDRFGPRRIAIFGALLYAVGLAITARATNAAMITLGTGVLVGIALSCTTSGIAANVAARVIVPERRSLGFGIVSAAGSMGTFFAAPLGQAGHAGGRLAHGARRLLRRKPVHAADGLPRRPGRPAAQLQRGRQGPDAGRRARRRPGATAATWS